jgi:hypothetical protein
MANEEKGLVNITTGEERNDANANGVLDLASAQVSMVAADVGAIDGFVVKYSSTTAVAITAGYCIANGKYYTLASDTTHTMTSLASAFDYHYIYVDDDASTAPTAVIIDSTTDPVWSDSKRGWYNGDDRCIGGVVSPTGSATLGYFDSSCCGSGKYIEYRYGLGSIPAMATDMNPDGTFQTPASNDGSVVTPVNAVTMFIRGTCEDVTDVCQFSVSSAEMAAVNTSLLDAQVNTFAYNLNVDVHKISLGASRNIKIGGSDTDDNKLDAYCVGFGITR